MRIVHTAGDEGSWLDFGNGRRERVEPGIALAVAGGLVIWLPASRFKVVADNDDVLAVRDLEDGGRLFAYDTAAIGQAIRIEQDGDKMRARQ